MEIMLTCLWTENITQQLNLSNIYLNYTSTDVGRGRQYVNWCSLKPQGISVVTFENDQSKLITALKLQTNMLTGREE